MPASENLSAERASALRCVFCLTSNALEAEDIKDAVEAMGDFEYAVARSAELLETVLDRQVFPPALVILSMSEDRARTHCIVTQLLDVQTPVVAIDPDADFAKTLGLICLHRPFMHDDLAQALSSSLYPARVS